MKTLWIDGGTTNTRFSLTQDETLVTRQTRHVGAANAQATHHNTALRQTVAGMLAELTAQYGEIDRICISGMITSASGLWEIQPLSGPAGLNDLAHGVQTIRLPGIASPVYGIPGVCFSETDVMRGEETELMGSGIQDALFFHFGSHNKAILMQDGRITASCTTLSGELLSAVTCETILRSSVPTDPPETLLEAEVLRGAQDAASGGLTRALFQTRLLTTLSGWSAAQAWSYLYGMTAAQDILAFQPLLTAASAQTIAYGRPQFTQAFSLCLPERRITQIPYGQSELLSLAGMQRIMEAYDRQKGRME